MASSGGCVSDMSNLRFEVVNNHFDIYSSYYGSRNRCVCTGSVSQAVRLAAKILLFPVTY